LFSTYNTQHGFDSATCRNFHNIQNLPINSHRADVSKVYKRPALGAIGLEVTRDTGVVDIAAVADGLYSGGRGGLFVVVTLIKDGLASLTYTLFIALL
jgi:hypothetical protein